MNQKLAEYRQTLLDQRLCREPLQRTNHPPAGSFRVARRFLWQHGTCQLFSKSNSWRDSLYDKSILYMHRFAHICTYWRMICSMTNVKVYTVPTRAACPVAIKPLRQKTRKHPKDHSSLWEKRNSWNSWRLSCLLRGWVANQRPCSVCRDANILSCLGTSNISMDASIEKPRLCGT